MFCQNCGAAIEPGVKFCPNCGSSCDVQSAANTAPVTEPTVVQPAAPSPAQQSAYAAPAYPQPAAPVGSHPYHELGGFLQFLAIMYSYIVPVILILGAIGVLGKLVGIGFFNGKIIANLIMMGAPVIIFISMSNVTGIQYMVPTGMYNQYSKSVIGGSLINFCVNLMLIPRIGAYGAVIGSVIAECTVTLLQIFMIRQKVHLGLTGRSFRIYFFGSLLMFAAVYGVGRVVPASVIGTALQVLAGVVVYAAVIILTKEELGWKMIEKVWYIKTSKS